MVFQTNFALHVSDIYFENSHNGVHVIAVSPSPAPCKEHMKYAYMNLYSVKETKCSNKASEITQHGPRRKTCLHRMCTSDLTIVLI